MTDTPTDGDRAAAARMLADPNALFIAHVENRENFTGVHRRFDQAAAAAGCHEEQFRTVPDSNGRPVFEVFRLACAEH